jgi:hypothetical protein
MLEVISMFPCICEHSPPCFYTWLLVPIKGALYREAVSAALTRVWTFKTTGKRVFLEFSVYSRFANPVKMFSTLNDIMQAHMRQCNLCAPEELLTRDNSEIVFRLPERVRNFLFLRSAQPHVQWVPLTLFLWRKVAGTWSWSFTSILWADVKNKKIWSSASPYTFSLAQVQV